MGVLSDVDISEFIGEGKISIEPYKNTNLMASTYCLTLGRRFLIPDHFGIYEKQIMGDVIDLDEGMKKYHEVVKDEIYIKPRQFIIGFTCEEVHINDELCARLYGKNENNLCGLMLKQSEHISPGFIGEIPLVLYNENDMSMNVKSGIDICQIEFHKLISQSSKTYMKMFTDKNK